MHLRLRPGDRAARPLPGGAADLAPPRRRAALTGAPLRVPRPADALAERWARLPPRVRALAVVLAVLVAGAAVQVRVLRAEHRWGGAPVLVLIAPRDLPLGAGTDQLVAVRRPPGAVPTGAVEVAARLGGGPAATLALPLPQGAALTPAHVDPRGPAAGLPADLHAVPVAAEPGWGLVAGGWVDVWVLAAGEAPPVQVARSRPVLDVRDAGGAVTALVGLRTDEVGPATAGVAIGRLLLTHAPPPPADVAPGRAPGRSTGPAPPGRPTDQAGRGVGVVSIDG